MRPLDQLGCQNSQCTLYGQRGRGNLSVCGWSGKNQTIRQLYCRACKARFSQRKGTPLYHAKRCDGDSEMRSVDFLSKRLGITGAFKDH